MDLSTSTILGYATGSIAYIWDFTVDFWGSGAGGFLFFLSMTILAIGISVAILVIKKIY